MESENYIVYVTTDSSGYITAVESSYSISDTTGWIEIDQGSGNRFCHAQGNYFPEPICIKAGVFLYKLVDGKPVECTPEEIAAQEKANKHDPSPSGDLESRVSTVESDVAALTAAIEKGLAL